MSLNPEKQHELVMAWVDGDEGEGNLASCRCGWKATKPHLRRMFAELEFAEHFGTVVPDA